MLIYSLEALMNAPYISATSVHLLVITNKAGYIFPCNKTIAKYSTHAIA